MSERLVAFTFLAASGAYLALSLPLPRGTPARPGAGFFPLAVGAFLCLVAAAFVVESLRAPRRAAGVAAAAPDGARARVAATVVGLVGFCVLLPWTGYAVAAFGFVTLLLWRLGERGVGPALAIALATAALSHYLFAGLLGVPLPRGPWLD